MSRHAAFHPTIATGALAALAAVVAGTAVMLVPALTRSDLTGGLLLDTILVIQWEVLPVTVVVALVTTFVGFFVDERLPGLARSGLVILAAAATSAAAFGVMSLTTRPGPTDGGDWDYFTPIQAAAYAVIAVVVAVVTIASYATADRARALWG